MAKSMKEILQGLEEISRIQSETSQQIQELRASQRQTDEQMKRTDEQIHELRVSQRQTDEQIQELRASQRQTDEQMKRTDEQMKKTDEQMKRTDKKLDHIGQRLGSMGINIGDMAEESFYRSLEETKTLGGMVFDTIERRVQMTDIDEEYDILLVNGSAVALIEVKYKLHPREIRRLLERKVQSFRDCFRKYDDHKLYVGFASMTTNPAMITAAKNEGLFGAVSECAFGPHAALAKKPEMLMYNMYTPLSELFAALPANQIHHSDPPLILTQPQGNAPRSGQ